MPAPLAELESGSLTVLVVVLGIVLVTVLVVVLGILSGIASGIVLVTLEPTGTPPATTLKPSPVPLILECLCR
jgi:ABC-type lipoprotein release transport system permease subunit